MTQSFDDVFEENYGFYIDDRCKHRYANSKEFGAAMYEAGQQSQQAEVDELKATIVKYEAGLRKNKANKHKILAKNIELQKRIDEVLEELEYPTSSWEEVIFFAIKKLKGNKDEN